jgi:hypothetical protein
MSDVRWSRVRVLRGIFWGAVFAAPFWAAVAVVILLATGCATVPERDWTPPGHV